MKIEITYDNGEKFIAYLAEETYENVMACLVDDVSVSVLHNMGKAEEEHTMEEFMYGQEGNPNDGSM